MSPFYYFLDYTVNTQQQSLYRGEARIEIASKTYQLLILLLKKPNETIPRKELIEYVWPDRVVSETSVDKLIQKLRKLLDDTKQHKTIIKTIHGVGYVFLPQVSTLVETVDIKVNWLSKLKYLPILIGITLVSLFILNKLQIIKTTTTAPENKATSIAFIPDITSIDDQDQFWMINGGLHYLIEDFNRSVNLETRNISLKTLGSEDPERFAIELNKNNQIDASVIVKITAVDAQFQAYATIRKSTGIIAENTLTSSSIKSLYDDIGSWVKGTLSIPATPTPSDSETMMSQDHYAVENYIRGMSSQLSGFSAEAIKYFDLAIKADPEFWLAWYEMGLSYRKQGQYEKSMAIFNTLESKPSTDKKNLMILNAKALNTYYMGEHAKAIEILNLAIEIARSTQDNNKLRIFLTNKALFANAINDYDTALKSVEESISLIKTFEGNHDSSFGSAYNTLAGIQINLYDFETAKSHAKLAVHYFKKSGNLRFQARAHSRLSSILYKMGDWKQGESMIKEALAIQQEVEDIRGQTTSYMRLCDYDLLKGDYKAAQNHLNLLRDLMTDITDKNQNTHFLITQIKFHLKLGEYQAAKNLLSELKQNTNHNSFLLSYYLLSLELHELNKDSTSWSSIAGEFTKDETLDTDPYQLLTLAQLAIKSQKTTQAIELFEKAKQLAFDQKTVHVIADIMNRYIIFLLSTNQETAYANILELEEHPIPTYPFLKVKAQVIAAKGEYFKASTLLAELKSKAGDNWTVDDQLLLESYKKHLQ